MNFWRLLFALVLVAGCGEAVKDDHFAGDLKQETPAPSTVGVPQAVPVRIGELGLSFAACGTAGTTRNVAADKRLPVRAAPFDAAGENGGIRSGTRFHVCTRSHDQKWLGVVYAPEGGPAECGVTSPVPARRAYDGPCESGWVQAASVKLIAG